MSVKRKKLYLPYSLPQKNNRYRSLDNSTGYIPTIYNQNNSTSSQHKDSIIIVDEQDGNSSWL